MEECPEARLGEQITKLSLALSFQQVRQELHFLYRSAHLRIAESHWRNRSGVRVTVFHNIILRGIAAYTIRKISQTW